MGRWVVYFSLAALPLFGLGQSLIPAEVASRRRFAFWLMTIYVASGLGLLLTTTLLGLRRYLRQRKLQMPLAMTGLWLGIGAAIIVGFLFVAALLPLSHPDYSLVSISTAGSRERDASRHAAKAGDAGQGEGTGGGEKKDAEAKNGSGGKGREGGKEAGQSGKPEGSGGDKAGGKSEGRSKSAGEPSNQGGGEKASRSDTSQETNSAPTGAFAALANTFKWITLILLAVILAFVVLWFVARHLAGGSDFARRLFEALSSFWRSLFGGSAPEMEDFEEAVVVQERPRPFDDFRNPFTDGSAARRSPEDLVRYSFAALEAWAVERDRPRRPDETPLEFGDRLRTEVPTVGEDAARLAALYARLAYARRRVPEACRPQLETFWRKLESAITFDESGAPTS
jgi:hypothetical protein